jgi:hypothetical protein
MTNTPVDLSKLKVGDHIRRRNGDIDEVVSISLSPVSNYAYIYVINGVSYTKGGFFNGPYAPDEDDIVEFGQIEPAPVESNDLEQRLANQIELTQNINKTLQEVKEERDALKSKCDSLRAQLSEQVRDYVSLMADLQRVMRKHFPS